MLSRLEFDSSKTMCATCGAETTLPSGAHELNPGLQWGSCCSIVSFLCGVLSIVV
jgi:hypothetical protein